ncbi:embryogenesis-associated protein EMB8-like, partial [Impatiens glandulifera]|uniref:embryogenesis-associated protein EMB8-like n=1 Tax=Impatiens glandulifera TaxID=253017 RepID=UPI001FB12FE6
SIVSSSTMEDSMKPHPSLEVIGGGTNSFFPGMKILTSAYEPYPIIGWNRHIETIFAAHFRNLPAVKFQRDYLRVKDGGVVSLDWVSGDNLRFNSDTPILILLPGLVGGSDDTYVRHMLVRARNRGFRVVVFNSRGCANSPVITPQFYSASFIDDLREVVAHVGSRYPESNLYAVAWSLGANILVRYLGQVMNLIRDDNFKLETDDEIPISGAVSLCNPFNCVMANEDLTKGFNNIYNKNLANSLCNIFKKHASLFEDMGGEYNIPMAANATTVRDFDEGLTRVSFGFKSADEYYFKSSSSDCIKYVRTPLLCIQAANDPIAPYRAIPFEDIKENPNCMLIVTPKGGHLGWIAGSEAPFGAPWTDSAVMDFLVHLVNGNSKADVSRRNETEVKEDGSNIGSLVVDVIHK